MFSSLIYVHVCYHNHFKFMPSLCNVCVCSHAREDPKLIWGDILDFY